jgi:PPP family 3-phenylpropionic acid transporter
VVAEKQQYKLLYFVLFASSNGILAFRNVYFREIGLSGAQMGILGAVIIATGMLTQPIWGVTADRYNRTKLVVAIGAIFSGMASLLYPLGQYVTTPFFILIGVSILFSGFKSPIRPLVNSMVLSSGIEFGSIRAFGSIAFGIGVLLVGALIERLGTSLIFYVYVVGMGLFVLLLVSVSSPDAGVSHDFRRKAIKLIQNRAYLILLIIAALVGGATATGDAFFSVYMRTIDVNDNMTGAVWFVRTLVESVVFLRATGIRLESRHQLSLSAIAYITVFLGYGVTDVLGLHFAIQLAHGIGIAFFELSTVTIAHQLAPEGLKSTAQAVMTMFGLGIGRVLGELIGGSLFDLVGAQKFYIYLTPVLVVAFILSFALYSSILVD